MLNNAEWVLREQTKLSASTRNNRFIMNHSNMTFYKAKTGKHECWKKAIRYCNTLQFFYSTHAYLFSPDGCVSLLLLHSCLPVFLWLRTILCCCDLEQFSSVHAFDVVHLQSSHSALFKNNLWSFLLQILEMTFRNVA